jgi:hypothetical protein
MRVLTRCVEHPFNVPVQGTQHANARVHWKVAAFAPIKHRTAVCQSVAAWSAFGNLMM